MNRNIIFSILILIILVGGGFFLLKDRVATPEEAACTLEARICPDGTAVGRIPPSCEFAECPKAVEDPHANLIRVTNPAPNGVITSPYIVRGEARGNWYFEASFPVKLYDANGKELAVTYAQAQGEWMTTEFVPFESNLTFETPTTATGTLRLEKDNASGLPEHDDHISIPVRFTP